LALNLILHFKLSLVLVLDYDFWMFRSSFLVFYFSCLWFLNEQTLLFFAYLNLSKIVFISVLWVILFLLVIFWLFVLAHKLNCLIFILIFIIEIPNGSSQAFHSMVYCCQIRKFSFSNSNAFRRSSSRILFW
jgi:hypothetical protein